LKQITYRYVRSDTVLKEEKRAIHRLAGWALTVMAAIALWCGLIFGAIGGYRYFHHFIDKLMGGH
jgi:hypothetical protein